jgi:hypothetical protein
VALDAQRPARVGLEDHRELTAVRLMTRQTGHVAAGSRVRDTTAERVAELCVLLMTVGAQIGTTRPEERLLVRSVTRVTSAALACVLG